MFRIPILESKHLSKNDVEFDFMVIWIVIRNWLPDVLLDRLLDQLASTLYICDMSFCCLKWKKRKEFFT